MTLISHLLLYGIKIFSPKNFNNTSNPQKEKLIWRLSDQPGACYGCVWDARDRLIYFMQFHTDNSRWLRLRTRSRCAQSFRSQIRPEKKSRECGWTWLRIGGIFRRPTEFSTPIWSRSGWCKTVYVFTFCCHFGALMRVSSIQCNNNWRAWSAKVVNRARAKKGQWK